MEININFNGVEIPLMFYEIKQSEFKRLLNIPGIYIILNKNREIIYVGISIDLWIRLDTHILGNTHTSYFSNEMEYFYFLEEQDEYKRDIIEKMVIYHFKPRYNYTSNYGAKKYDDDIIIKIKYLLQTKKYTQRQISEGLEVNHSYVSSISKGRSGRGIDIPENFFFELEGFKIKNKVSDDDLEKVYKKIIKGFTYKETSNETGVNISMIRRLMNGKQKRELELRKKFREKYGSKLTNNRKSITDEEITKTFKMRFIYKMTLPQIWEKVNFSKASVSQILYRLQPRYKNIYNEFVDNNSNLNLKKDL